MKVKTKISVLTVISSCFFFLTSFVNSNSQNVPSPEVRCEIDRWPVQYNSKLLEIVEVECNVCELVNIVTVWNSEGLLEGTLYEYSLGSEPALLTEIECQYSSNYTDNCQHVVVYNLGGCLDVFIPCTKEDDPECVND